jgi:hypothetical protein
MTKSLKLLTGSLLLAFTLFAARSACAAPQAASSKVPVTTVVTVLGPTYTAPPPLEKADIVVHTGNVREDVTAWVPAQGDRGALQLAILIDDVTDNSSFGNQLSDLRKFIQAQSKSTSIGVFYANNGRAQAVSPFNADHDAATKNLRITRGEGGASVSIYLSLMDLISRWPATAARREVLVIADGIDRLRGDPDSPDVTLAFEKAQKAGIMLHTLYARGFGHAGRNLFRVNFGQSNLAQMTDATGGESFFQGTETPISFSPFQEQLDMVLHNQFFLTFTTARSAKKKGELRRFRITTEQTHVEIGAARAIFVPGPK